MCTEISHLANGLTIVTHNMQQMESVALGVWIKAGSRHESPQQHGIAHFLEHMAFKGTHQRSAFKIATDIEDVGGEINAVTSIETTVYYARVLKENVPLAVEILADILINPKFDEAELEREKQVVLQEINAAYDTPDDIIFDHFTQCAFQNQAIGRSILGTAQTVQSFTRADLLNFTKENYNANRMIIVATGAVDHNALHKEVSAHFSNLPKQNIITPPAISYYTGGDFREHRALLDTQLILGFEGHAFHTADSYATQLLAYILGGGMSSRLFQEVRERRGLCYSINASHWSFSDTGLFAIHAATRPEALSQVIPLIVEQLIGCCENITQAELDRARAQYRSALLMAHEDPSSRSQIIARQMLLHGHPISPTELMERLDLISCERLSSLSQALFFNKSLTLAGLGPIENLTPYPQIQQILNEKHTAH